MHTHYTFTTPQLAGSRFARDQSTASSTTGLTPTTDLYYSVPNTNNNNSNNKKRLLDASNAGNTPFTGRIDDSTNSDSDSDSDMNDIDDDVTPATKRQRSNSVAPIVPQYSGNRAGTAGYISAVTPLPPTPLVRVNTRDSHIPYYPGADTPISSTNNSMHGSEVHATAAAAISDFRTETISNNMINSNNSSSSNSSSNNDSAAKAPLAKRKRDEQDDIDDGSLDDSILDAHDKQTKRSRN
jgi:hypothetical protein